MEVDLFMELASPPIGGRTPAQVVDDSLALARAGDAAGFGAVWIAEHHFLGDYSNAACPEMLLAAIARETDRIKLGFGVIPLPIHDVTRVAERLATLDILSGGRVLWGVGRGVTVTELGAFGIETADSRAVFLARYNELRRILDTGHAERQGRSLQVRPRPAGRLGPGWLACVSPESFDFAVDLTLNVMTGPFKPWPLVRADLKRYRQKVCATTPGRPGATSFTLAAYCMEDHQTARRRAEPGLIWAYRQIMEVTRPLLARQLAGYEHYRKLGWLAPLLDRLLSLPLLEKMGLAAVGNPAHVARRLQALQESGLDRVSLVIGGGDLDVRETTDCIALLADQVLPSIRPSP